ncbi:hypothetical protein [Ilumatobacter sp.]|uniref:hypothetical protein n=1 Tax=Ilumatobacter sp. TaxID=1967498 RepID=UPI003751875A
MATKMLNSLKGRVIRITRLNDCGVPVVGLCSSIVTAGFITLGFAPEVESGEEYTQKNAWGDFCISEKDADINKWVNVSLSLCEVNPDILDIVGGGSPIIDGTDTIGSSFGAANNTEGFAIEVWTKQAGGNCAGGVAEWGYFVAPFCINGTLDGSVTIENGTMAVDLKGQGQAAVAAWGVNPYGDNPLLAGAGFPVGDMWAVVRTTVQPPAVTDGCVALA